MWKILVLTQFSSIHLLSRVWLFATPGLQHTRLPCPSPVPGACSNSCPSSQWCHSTISSLVIPFSSCLHSFTAWGSFPGSCLLQVAQILEFQLQHQDWLLGHWWVWSPRSPRDSQVSSSTPQFKSINSLTLTFLYGSTLTHIHTWLLEKTIALTRRTFVVKVMTPLLNMLSRLVIASLPRSKHLLMSWLQSPPAVILELKKINSLIVSPSICHEVMEPDAMDFIFWMLSFKPAFSLSFFTFIKRLFSCSSLSAIRVVSSAYLKLLIFLLAILIPACASSSLAFCMMYSAYKLNKQGDNTQPWCIPFPIWNLSVIPHPVLTIASWPAFRFLRRQVRWSDIPISFRIFHSLLWSTQSKAFA